MPMVVDVVDVSACEGKGGGEDGKRRVMMGDGMKGDGPQFKDGLLGERASPFVRWVRPCRCDAR